MDRLKGICRAARENVKFRTRQDWLRAALVAALILIVGAFAFLGGGR